MATITHNEYPIYNARACSWADATVTCIQSDIPLFTLADIKAINTGSSVERGKVIRGGRVVQLTSGVSTLSASLTFYEAGYDTFITNLSAVAPLRQGYRVLSQVIFGLKFYYTPVGDEKIYGVSLVGCSIDGRDRNGAEGSDPSEVEVPLSVLDVVDITASGVQTVIL